MGGNSDSDLKLVEYTLSVGRIDEAEKICREILASNPRSVEALVLLARISERGGRGEMAIQLYRKALKIDPSQEDALNELETLLYTSERHMEAIEVWQGQIAYIPDDPRAHRNLGMCYLALGKFSEAAACFSRALELQPDSAPLYQRLGHVYQNMGKHPEAADAFRKAITLQPREPSLHIALAQTLVRLNDSEGAVYAFRRASELEPGSVRASLQLAEALIEDGQSEEAEQQLKKIISLDPGAVAAYVLLGRLQLQLGQFEDASQNLKEAIRLDPRHVPAYYHSFQNFKTTDEDRDLVEALAVVERDELTPEERRMLHYALGKAYDDLGDYERAMVNFDEANQLAGYDRRREGRPFSAERYLKAFDFMIEHFTGEFFEQFEILGSLDELPLLVVGMMRSGAALIERILSAHPQIGAGGDLRYWTDRAKTLNSLGAPPRREKLAEVADAYHQLLRDMAPGKKRVTDKYPQNCMYLGPIHLIFPKARIIHCRRDPIDTCLSIYTTPMSDPPDFAYSRENIVFIHREYQRLMQHWREVLPSDRFLEVDYEELVSDPERVTRQMVEFSGLDWDDACLPDRAVATAQASEPVYKTSVERWRRYEPWLGEFAELRDTVVG